MPPCPTTWPAPGKGLPFLRARTLCLSFPVLRLVLLGSAGLFFGLPNTLLHLPLLALLYPFCLYILARQAKTWAEAMRRGWLLGLAANVAGLYWLIFPMRDVAGIPYALAVPCVLLLLSYFACYAALFAFAVWNLSRPGSLLSGLVGFFCGKAPWRQSLRSGKSGVQSAALSANADGATQNNPAKNRPPQSISLLIPPLAGLAFAGFEVCCGHLFTGFPWLSLGAAFGFSPAWMQTAALFGGFGLSALMAAAACLAAESLVGPAKSKLPTLAVALALLTAMPVYGHFRLAGQADAPAGRALSVLMVQGNIDQNQKWLPAFQRGTLDLYMQLSREAMADLAAAGDQKTPDLLLWPETAMPFYFDRHPDYARELYRFAVANDVYFAFGSLGIESGRNGGQAALKNRLYMLSPTGRSAGFYDKRHLVPFGEYMPFAADIPLLRDLLQGMDFFPGDITAPLRIRLDGTAYALGALICYEAIFQNLAQERVAHGATMLLNVSNDGWFRDSSAPRQHLAHVALRAVEQKRPVLRATNTGITATLDAYGRITARVPELFAPATLAVKLAPETGLTLYHRLYPLPEAILVVLALFSLLRYRVKNGGMDN